MLTLICRAGAAVRNGAQKHVHKGRCCGRGQARANGVLAISFCALTHALCWSLLCPGPHGVSVRPSNVPFYLEPSRSQHPSPCSSKRQPLLVCAAFKEAKPVLVKQRPDMPPSPCTPCRAGNNSRELPARCSMRIRFDFRAGARGSCVP